MFLNNIVFKYKYQDFNIFLVVKSLTMISEINLK